MKNIVGKKVKLLKEVTDCETGLFFPVGATGEVALCLDSGDIECKFDTAIADPIDSGNYAYPIVKRSDIEILE